MKSKVLFSAEELKAIKTIASIQCGGITCINCPLNLENIRTNKYHNGTGCFRNTASDIVYIQEEKDNEK